MPRKRPIETRLREAEEMVKRLKTEKRIRELQAEMATQRGRRSRRRRRV